MSIFVLVHGAGQTSASWDLVIPRLREAGRTVVVARLSGLENDNVPLSPAINLRTHIEDVSRLLVEGNLEQVTLIGHSYGGMIITGVAEALVDRLDRLVYVDALIPADGQCALDLLPEPLVQMFRQAAESSGNGWRLRAGESYLDLWGLKPGPERDFVRERMSDFSLRCFEEVITLPSNAASKLDRTFIACVAEGYPARPVFRQFGDRAKSEGWEYHELPTGHDCHVQLPNTFVSALLASSTVSQ